MPNVMLNIDIEDIEKIDAIVLERNAQRIDRGSIAKKFSPVLTAEDLDKAHKLRKERGIGTANKFLKELTDKQREEAMAMQPRASRTNIALEMVTRGLAAHSAKHAPNPVKTGARKRILTVSAAQGPKLRKGMTITGMPGGPHKVAGVLNGSKRKAKRKAKPKPKLPKAQIPAPATDHNRTIA